MDSFLAIDIGAGSGRHILGMADKNKLLIKEVYRFDNGMIEKNGSLCWDLPAIFEHVVAGIKECVTSCGVPRSLAIDTWGVDFVLLDENNGIIGDSVAYRDSRTAEMDAAVERILPFSELYRRTGIQKMILNSIYQLMSIKQNHPEQLEKAAHFLLIPDYLNYLLTGRMLTEYTNASTTSLVNLKTKNWDYDLIEQLGLPAKIFGDITAPGVPVGRLSEEIKARVGTDIDVFLVPTHDTASAFIAMPSGAESSVFISSGTWSLLGIETLQPIVTDASAAANFTNEGGYNYVYRFLKNIMGLWMLQSVRRNLDMKYSYTQLGEMARAGSGYAGTVNVNDNIFIAPKSMIDAVHTALQRDAKQLPQNLEETLYCIYHSLAVSYMDNIAELQAVTGKSFSGISIVGGGSQDDYLNELTAAVTGLKVVAGPVEATAIGNLLIQMISNKTFTSLQQARAAVTDSFELKKYLP